MANATTGIIRMVKTLVTAGSFSGLGYCRQFSSRWNGTKVLWVLALAFLVSPARAATYYVCAATGSPCNASDSNAGTSKSATWLHAPGMPNFTGTYSFSSGDQIILRGGDTWHFGNSGAAPYTGGSWTWSHANAYLGVDLTWDNSGVCGGSWCRPIFTGDNPLWAGGGNFPASCAFDNSSMGSFINLGSTASVQVDNFEFTGNCWTVNSSSNRGDIQFNGASKVSNNYMHGWTMTSGADDNWPAFQTVGATGQTEIGPFNVVDGSDSPHFAAGTVIAGSSNSPACQWSADGNAGITNVSETSGSVVTLTIGQNYTVYLGGAVVATNGLTTATWLNGKTNMTLSGATATTISFTDPTGHGTLGSTAEVGVAGLSACASGQAINGAATYNVHDNVFRYLSNMGVSGNLSNYSNNLVENLYATFASGSLQQHPNIMNDLGSSGTLTFSGNVMRHTFVTEDVYLAVSSSGAFVYNNVFFDNMNSIFGPFAGSCFRYNNAPGTVTGAVAYFYNNTMGDNTCNIQFAPSNSPLLAYNGTANFENNHFIGTTLLTQNYGNSSGNTITVNDNGGERYMTTGTATTQGYTAANDYAPTLGTNSTVGAGNNLTSSCSTFGAALCSGAGAPSEATGSGGKIAVSPSITIVARPSSSAWDSGAYQFSGVPTVTTTVASSITNGSASAGGTVTSNGGASVTLEGTCYGLTANPVSPCTSDGTATPFTSILSGLSTGTLYHYRAFATNSAGTGYGSDLTFATSTACGPPNYPCSTSSTSNPGTIAPIFIATSPTAITCSGDCQNSVHYDQTLNAPPLNPITRLTDGTIFPSGQSVGNVTCSGGDNDLMGSIGETYLGLVQGGFARIFKMTVAPDKSYRVATLGPAGLAILCPIAFSQTSDNVIYEIKGATQIWKYTITSYPTTTSSEIYDITGATGGFQPCPGINWATFGTPSTNSILGVSKTDGRLAFAVGPGGQGSADIVVVWDQTLGCATINYNTGQWWTFCNSSCSASTPASGTLSSSGCYGSQGSINKGIHDVEFSGDGNTLVVSANSGGGWTGGLCNGQTWGDMFSITTVNSSTDFFGYNGTGVTGAVCCMGGHESAGVTHTLTPYFGGPDIVLNSNPATQTTFSAATVQTDVHASWPHPLGDDSYQWIFANDLQADAQNSGCSSHAECPTYPNNLIGAWFPGTAYPPGKNPTLFSHTFSCNNGSGAACPGGVHDAYFGGQQSIGYVTAKGNYFVWASTHLCSLGNDNNGNCRQDAFSVGLDQTPGTTPTAPFVIMFSKNGQDQNQAGGNL